MQGMIKMFRYLKDYIPQSIIGPLFKFIEACFELAVPIVVSKIIDVGIRTGDTGYVLKMGGILVLFGVFGLLFSITAQFFAAQASMGMGKALRADLFRHINSLSFKELDSAGTTTLITRLTNDVNQVQSGINLVLRLLLRSPFILLGAVVMSFTVSAKLGVIFVITVPILALVVYVIMSRLLPKYKNVQKNLDKLSVTARENLQGSRVIRAFSGQERERERFAAETEALCVSQTKAGSLSALLNPMTLVIVNLAIIAIIYGGAKATFFGELTQGDVVALVNYMTQILTALLAFADLIIMYTKASASASRINDIFDYKPSMESGNGAAPDLSSSAVSFDNVSFAYDSEPVLENISFSIQKGQTLGIIGGTGSGKSTLASLVYRAYDANSGEITLFGNDIKNYSDPELRKLVSVVPQHAVLFAGTVRENLQWRNSAASDDELLSALDIAQAGDMVSSQADFLDKTITKNGRNLSGGQRQRLTIARALVGNPEILILDDSASALDYATDAKLRKALKTLENTTKIIISQRVYAVKDADLILVLDDGKIAGAGKHDALIKSCPVYAEICSTQLDPGGADDEK